MAGCMEGRLDMAQDNVFASLNELIEKLERETQEKSWYKAKLEEASHGYCGYCGQMKPVSVQRQNTQYVDEQMNWIVCCDGCFIWIEEEWAERWAEYNASRL